MLKDIISKYKNSSVQIRASFWFVVCSFVQRGISVITTPIFTRLLSSAEYGKYNVFNSWSLLVTIIVSLNMSGGLYPQGLIKFENERNKFESSLQFFSTVLVSAWCIIYLLFQQFFNSVFSLSTYQVLLMLIMSWSSSILSFWMIEQRVDYKYAKLVVLTIVLALCKPIISILLIYLIPEDKVTARILGIVGIEFFVCLFLYFVKVKKNRLVFNTSYWKYALVFCIPLIPHYLSQYVLSSSDRIMIGKMVGDSEAGIYGLAYSISQIMTLFNSALLGSLSPWMLKRIKENRISDISKITYPCLIGIGCINLGLIAFAPEVVSLFAPIEYYEAIWVIPPVAISTLFVFEYDLFACFEFYYEKTRFISVATMISAGLNLALNYIFIRSFGYVAAAYTTLICYALYAFAHFSMMQYICKKEIRATCYKTIDIILISAVFTGASLVLMFTYNNTIIRYAIVCSALIAIIVFRKKIVILFERIFATTRQ